MTKWMLLKYEVENFQALNQDGLMYLLTLRVSDFWGLLEYTQEVKALIPYNLRADEVYKELLNKWVTPKQARELVNQRNK